MEKYQNQKKNYGRGGKQQIIKSNVNFFTIKNEEKTENGKKDEKVKQKEIKDNDI